MSSLGSTRRIESVQIQVLSAHHAVGGGARDARALARGLRDQGVRVSILCTGDARPDVDPVYDEIVAVTPRSAPLLWRWQPLGALPFWLATVRRTTRDIDAVISLTAPQAVATHWGCPGVPLLFAPAVLDRVENPTPQYSPYKWCETQAFRAADRVLIRHAGVREVIESLYRPLRKPVGIALPGIDDAHAECVQRDRTALGIPHDAKLLVTVGLVNENKGQRYIAEALRRCAQADWWWAIVGDGSDRPAIEAALADSPMRQRTRFVGVDPNMGDWYAAADCLVACSRHETFGEAIAEALWVGVPVVIPKHRLHVAMSPLAEAVEHFGLGRTFPRNDPAALASALSDVLTDESERCAIGDRARAFARENFSASRYAQCALRLFASTDDITYPLLSPDATPAASSDPAHAQLAPTPFGSALESHPGG